MSGPPRIPSRAVVESVAISFGVETSALIGDGRTRSITRPRQFAMYALRMLCPHLSLPMIGRALGGRDHTTIIHGLRKVESLIAEGEFSEEIARLESWFDRTYLDARIEEAEQRLASLKAIRETVQQVAS